MKFSVQEDIAAPIEYVFERITDFDAFERGALRRGAKVVRVEAPAEVEGTKWDLSFRFRGSERHMMLKVATYDRPNTVVYRARIKGLIGVTTLELVALSPSRTRLTLNVKLVSKSIKAKIVIQSLKIARRRIMRKLRKRMANLAETIEDDYKRVV